MRMETAYQLEWHGYLVADRKDDVTGNPVFIWTVTLRNQ